MHSYILEVFYGNEDRNTKVHYDLKPFTARVVRLHPVAFHGTRSLRWELFGCALGKSYLNTFIVLHSLLHDVNGYFVMLSQSYTELL